jgi:DNA segregation ATPase FtsK/SpoIIIE-like protein
VAKKGIGIELGTIVITAFAIFSWVAIFSYHSSDPSYFTQSTETVLNSCGAVGASLSAIILQFFGLASFLVPVGFLFIAARVHSSDGFARALSSLAGLSLSVISLTVFLSLHWKMWHWSGTQFLTGGVLGAWLSVPLEHALNSTGASIVSLAVFAGTLVVATPIGIANLLSKFIHAAGVVSYRIARLAGTYAAYYSAIALNKLAQFIGMQAKKSFEQIKERADAYRLAKAQARSALVHEVTVDEAKAKIAKGQTEASLLAKESQELSIVTLAPTGAETTDLEDAEEVEALEAARAARAKAKKTPPVKSMITSSAEEANVEEDDAIFEESIISASELRKAAKRKADAEENSAGPVIEKAVAGLEGELKQTKFKFDTSRGKWKLPIIDFLRKATRVETAIDRDRLTERAKILSDKLEEFGIDGEVTAMRVGPVITLYEFKPGPGIKVSRISGLIEDLSMALSSKSVRILAPLPGKAVVGIEIPSETREQVLLREFLQTGQFQDPKYQIPVVMGKDIAGQSIFADLAKMPHLLVSGQTGSGKSVFMNGLICSLLYRFTPDELRLILVDPKFIEFSFYHDIPHLLLPVVDDPKNASASLKWAVREMERRYRILEAAGVRNLQSYNEKIQETGAEPMAKMLQEEAQAQEASAQIMTGGDWIEAFEKDETGAPIIGKLPYIVIIIDELADLMMTVKKDVE